MSIGRRRIAIGAASLAAVLLAIVVGLWLGVPAALRWGLETFAAREVDFQIQGEGVVIRILSDDLVELRDQRFIIRISPKQSLLVTHNIDVANRVPNLADR